LQALGDGLEKRLEVDDGVEIVAGRVEADDNVPTPTAKPFEDREEDLVVIVSRAVRLDA
jgi:hypothetical protein